MMQAGIGGDRRGSASSARTARLRRSTPENRMGLEPSAKCRRPLMMRLAVNEPPSPMPQLVSGDRPCTSSFRNR
jgi:hypothetical protein